MTRTIPLRVRDAVDAGVLHPVDQPFPPGAHDRRSAQLLGRLLGSTVAIAFVTGLISHLHQHPLSWLDMPSRPVWGYQVTQGLHVIAGIACIPLLLAKLWVVYRRLFVWPPVRDVAHGLERLLLVPLVAGMLFEVTTGMLNVVRWYPWPFFFPRVHYAVAWLVIGSLLAHLAFKSWRRDDQGVRSDPDPIDPDPIDTDHADADSPDADRRALLLGAVGSAALATLATAGQTVPFLRGVSVLAPRDVADGAQGLAVNRTVQAAGVLAAATDPAWTLTVDGDRPLRLGLAELAAMPQHAVRLPLACVEGWSYTATWSGVRLRDLLEAAGMPADAHLYAVSLERNSMYARSPLNPGQAWDPLTVLALRVNGEVLHPDHGYPLRLIAPNRPGVQQTKWLSRIERAT